MWAIVSRYRKWFPWPSRKVSVWQQVKPPKQILPHKENMHTATVPQDLQNMKIECYIPTPIKVLLFIQYSHITWAHAYILHHVIYARMTETNNYNTITTIQYSQSPPSLRLARLEQTQVYRLTCNALSVVSGLVTATSGLVSATGLSHIIAPVIIVRVSTSFNVISSLLFGQGLAVVQQRSMT